MRACFRRMKYGKDQPEPLHTCRNNHIYNINHLILSLKSISWNCFLVCLRMNRMTHRFQSALSGAGKKLAVDIWQYYKIRKSVDRPSTKNQQNNNIDHHHQFIIMIDYRQLIIICPSISKIIISITSSIHHH
jgi:hypothetical protein